MRQIRPCKSAGPDGTVGWPAHATVLVLRGGVVESRHRVSYALVDRSGRVVESAGDIVEPVFLRSVAKPLFCAAIADAGAFDAFGFSERDIALAAGSHSGEAKHVAAVRTMLRSIGLTPNSLRCGAHAPLDPKSAAALERKGKRPTALHNNCSGNHAALLALSLYRGISPTHYLLANHEAEKEVIQACARLLEISPREMLVRTDGCGMPTIAAPLRNVAASFARIGGGDDGGSRSRSLARVAAAMTAHPYYVAGTGRFDTALMQTMRSRLVCKSGAEGVFAAGLLASGLGLALKVVDGNDRAVAPFVTAFLERLGFTGGRRARALELFRRSPLANHARANVGVIVSGSDD